MYISRILISAGREDTALSVFLLLDLLCIFYDFVINFLPSTLFFNILFYSILRYETRCQAFGYFIVRIYNCNR